MLSSDAARPRVRRVAGLAAGSAHSHQSQLLPSTLASEAFASPAGQFLLGRLCVHCSALRLVEVQVAVSHSRSPAAWQHIQMECGHLEHHFKKTLDPLRTKPKSQQQRRCLQQSLALT